MDKEEPYSGSPEDTKQRILQMLSTTRVPISDVLLVSHLEDEGYEQKGILNAASELVKENKVRWIPYRGYVIGGRPVK